VILPGYMTNKQEKEEDEREGGRKKGGTHRFMIHPLKRPQRRSNIENHQPLDFIRMIQD
jgi:hypothetical protein